jgi:hypothetical protein
MKNLKPTPDTDTATSLKRKKTCEGGREHDWVEEFSLWAMKR